MRMGLEWRDIALTSTNSRALASKACFQGMVSSRSEAGVEFTAIHVRGHSRDAHCYLARAGGRTWLFSGDVVFYGGVLGLINADGSGMEGYRADIDKLAGLGVEGLFPGHGLFTLCGG